MATNLCSFLVSINEYPYFRFDCDDPLTAQIAAKAFLNLEERVRYDADFWFRGCMDIHNRSTVLIVSRKSDMITPFLHSVAYEAMMHDYFHVGHDGKLSMIPHQALSFLSGGLPSSVDVNESSSLWNSIRDLRYERTLMDDE